MRKVIRNTGPVILLPLAVVLSLAGLFSTGSRVEAACTYSIVPTTQAFSYGPGGGTVAVTTTSGCTWTVVNTNGWISILSPTNNTNSGSVSYTVQTNPVTLNRTGLVTIAGQIFKVTQTNAPCTFSISPMGRTNGYGISTGTVSVTTSSNCSWGVNNTNLSWITIVSGASGTGTGTVTYTLTANPSLNNRSSVLTIAGQPFNLTQHGIPCTFSISPMTRTNGNGATTGSVSLTASSNLCAWTVSTPSSWIHITSPTSGTGNTNVTFNIDANPSSIWRTGLVMIADQVFSEIQRGAPCNYSISPTSRNHGRGATTNSVSITVADDCPWTAAVVNNSTWVNIVPPTNGSGSNSVSYTIEANPTGLMRTGLLVIAGQLFTLIQTNSTCTFSLSPTNGTHSSAMETGVVSVTTLVGCGWAVATTNDWITVTSSTNNTGSGSVTYVVAANPSITNRTGFITIDSKSFSVTQQGNGCTYKLSATTRNHGYTGTTTGLVTVTTSNGCSWTAVPSTNWITITSGASGTGTSNINYTVDPNPTPYERTGLVLVADQVLTLIQHGFPCTFSLSTTNRHHGHGATNNMVALNASSNACPWIIVNTNSWITITSGTNGFGDTNVSYTVGANPNPTERTGVVMIADQFLTLGQSGVTCSYSLSATTRNHGYGAVTGQVIVTTSPACTWDVANTNSWITILTNSSGMGSNTVVYAVAADANLSARSGTLVVEDQVLTLNQAGAACAFALSPDSGVHGYGSDTGLVTVATSDGCTWNATTTNGWITFTSTTNGSGAGSVAYAVTANLTPTNRVGGIAIDSQFFTITQFGTNCSGFVLSPVSASRTHGYGAATNTVMVNTSSNCAWTVVNTNNWITIISGTNGTGTGTVTYAVLVNASFNDRMGVLLIGGQPFSLTQLGYACTDSISPTIRPHGYTASGGTISLTTSSNTCPWTVVDTNSWITIISATNGIGNATISYTVDANPTVDARMGVVMIADQPLLVTQTGIPCNLKLSTTNRTHGFATATQ